MPRTDIVRVYRSKGGSDTIAIVIPKAIREVLGIQKGDRLRATARKGRELVFRRV